MLHTVHTSVHTTAPLHLTHLHYPSWCNILISTQFHLFEHSSHLLRIRDNWKTTACLCLSMLLKQLQVSRSGRQSMLPDVWVSVVTNGQYSMKWAHFLLFPPFKKKKKRKNVFIWSLLVERQAGWTYECCSYVVQAVMWYKPRPFRVHFEYEFCPLFHFLTRYVSCSV